MADAVAETSPERLEHARLPRVLHLVMGYAAVAAVVALVAIVTPDVARNEPSAPSHAPDFEQPLVPAAPKGRAAPEHSERKPWRDAPTPAAPPSWHASPKPEGGGEGKTVSRHDEQVTTNVQDSTTNVNESAHVQVNRVVSTSSSKHVSSSGSVSVVNDTDQVVKSGAGTNSVHVESSVRVSKSGKFSNSSG